MPRRFLLVFLLLVSVSALFWRLGGRGLNEPDEGRYATIAVQMYDRGDWLVPRLFERAHVEKPPLTHWLIILAFKAFGVSEFSARLPSALAGLGTVLLTWAIGRRVLGDRSAVPAALILLTSPFFFIMARLCDPNMVLTFWVTLGFWALIGWFADGRRWQLHVAYLALALSFMAKGPVGLLLVLLTMIAFRMTRPGPGHWRVFGSLSGVLLFAVVAFPWFLILAWRHPELWNFFIRQELFERYLTKAHARYEPPWYYLTLLPAFILPWMPSCSD